MAHPQTSPRGYVQHTRVGVGASQLTSNSTALLLSGGIALSGRSTSGLTEDSTGLILAGALTLSGKSTAQLTQDSTGLIAAQALTLSGKSTAFLTQDATSLILAGDLKINNVLNINGDSTGILLVSGNDTAGLAGNIAAGNIQIGTNSTGATFIAVRTTGTTWKYLNVTTALPT